MTYTGTASHLVLAAFVRADVTPDLGFDENFTTRVRAAASLLATWFTCEQADARHMAAFSALPPRATCELVALAVRQRSVDSLKKVGAHTLAQYTDFLLSGGADDEFPKVVDEPMHWLSAACLDIRATAGEGVEEVTLGSTSNPER